MAAVTDVRIDVARGIVLLGVFYVHALYILLNHFGDPGVLQLAWLQIKLLAPHVVLFFALSGMTSAGLPEKSLRIVGNRAVLLILIAIFSHVIGVLIEHTLWKPWTPIGGLLKEIVKPIVLGTGHSTYVAWFFVVLAVVRCFAFLLASNRRHFFVALAVAAAAVGAAELLQFPGDFYEWRNWPAAFLMFLLGTYLVRGWRVPHAVGLTAAVVGLGLSLVNRPELFTEGICLHCDIQFVAGPEIGGQGVMPLYLVQELLTLIGLLWLSRVMAMTPLARALAWFGRRSLKLLVLHGWVILSFYGLAAHVLLESSSAWLFAAVFAGYTLLHFLLYEIVNRPLNRFMLACSQASRRLVALFPSGARGDRRGTSPRPQD
jgi:peptidoglycan/LPS O-acetylase OafA/YrhL